LNGTKEKEGKKKKKNLLLLSFSHFPHDGTKCKETRCLFAHAPTS